MCTYIGCFCPICEKRLQTLRVPCEKAKKGETCGEFTEARDYVEDDPCEKCFKRRQPTIANKAKDIARRFTGGGSGSAAASSSKKMAQTGDLDHIYGEYETDALANCAMKTFL
ncbi:uncharacterized protein TrAtP1_012867 [Trichoderma atroviride]|uniref:Uncharacterized protein n=1 Tax=Hypocrea atroviridis (strain ATCC 20476 / IMI 206040) TaxID=452589 RepID=G9NUT0_HYPAI|nr:uncharacterized protein TRIATDRAFT_317939 [Trichoderma atroviride IMI 206040]EHK45805.1 hypothetical protein TRIATDRAFT_317939 [Trichoderma atroviride IMI 206040]UKZ71924.1 hypothetical protein TrAtP1_012867 [Trichoderma atroviride]